MSRGGSYRLYRSTERRGLMNHMPTINDPLGKSMPDDIFPGGNELDVPNYQSLAEPINPELDDARTMDPLRMGF